MKKILFLSNTANFSKFNKPYMRWFKSKGWQVDYCSCGEEEVEDCDNQYKISIVRNPFSFSNVRALKQLKKILNENNYSLIHCHTPMGGVLGRFAAKKLRGKNDIKVIYTAHGFHFYKGAPLFNWLIYYPIEKYLAKMTDIIVTINEEDYERAKGFNSKVFKIDGVGVNLEKFYPCLSVTDKEKLRCEYNFANDDFILLYTAEFIPRKNHVVLFNILPELKRLIPNLKVILCGKGVLLDYYKEYAENKKMTEYVVFTGYTNNVADYCRLSDLLVMPSLQEGLPLALIEAIATGLPVVASRIRGHTDVIENDVNGYLYTVDDEDQLKELILKLKNNPNIMKRMSEENVQKSKIYSIENAISAMGEIYSLMLDI